MESEFIVMNSGWNQLRYRYFINVDIIVYRYVIKGLKWKYKDKTYSYYGMDRSIRNWNVQGCNLEQQDSNRELYEECCKYRMEEI